MERRDFLRSSIGVAIGATVGTALATTVGAGALHAASNAATLQPALPAMTVYKSASCGCCTLWVDYARKKGFTVKTVDTEDLATVKREMGVPANLYSCHTVVVGSYLLEGHVPAADVKRLLAQKPKVRGLAVPGMPVGSPGMEQGPPSGYDRYDVIAFTADGKQSVFATHGPPKRG